MTRVPLSILDPTPYLTSSTKDPTSPPDAWIAIILAACFLIVGVGQSLLAVNYRATVTWTVILTAIREYPICDEDTTDFNSRVLLTHRICLLQIVPRIASLASSWYYRPLGRTRLSHVLLPADLWQVGLEWCSRKPKALTGAPRLPPVEYSRVRHLDICRLASGLHWRRPDCRCCPRWTTYTRQSDDPQRRDWLHQRWPHHTAHCTPGDSTHHLAFPNYVNDVGSRMEREASVVLDMETTCQHCLPRYHLAYRAANILHGPILSRLRRPPMASFDLRHSTCPQYADTPVYECFC